MVFELITNKTFTFLIYHNFFLWVLLLPLISAVTISFIGRFLGKKGAIIIASILMFTNIYGILLTLQVYYINNQIINIKIIPWILSFNLNIFWGCYIDGVSLFMLTLISVVSTTVHLYSYSYMSTDPHIIRFISYLSFFTFFMEILVISDNFLQIFFAWEGVGICSYLLIGFWNSRLQANKSSLKALIVNRIGDLGLILGIFLTYFTFKSLDFTIVFSLTPYFSYKYLYIYNNYFPVLEIISFFMFIGAMGKSAQLGLHTWLPDAMEGPTPVSALIHAATMVTAGVFLVIRISPILEYTFVMLNIIAFLGALTAFFAASIGLVQNDIKKIVAYSTCSQLGYMFCSCGLSNYTSGFFHLFNHGFFKALLFLGSGCVIHSILDEQDLRKMGGLNFLIPITYICILVGSLALIGFPFLSGFYSKDIILEVAFLNIKVYNSFIYFLLYITTFLTSFYSTRMLYIVFHSYNNSFKAYIKQIHEVDYNYMPSLFTLFLGSLFSGYYFKQTFLGLNNSFFKNSIFIIPNYDSSIDIEFIPFMYKNIPLFCTLGGFIISYFTFKIVKKKINFVLDSTLILYIYKFFYKKWYFDQIYNIFFIKNTLFFSYHFIFKKLDKGVVENFGPYGLSYKVFNIVKYFNLQTGYLLHYSFIFLFTFVYLLIAFTLFGLYNNINII